MSLCAQPWSCRVLTPPVCWSLQAWPVSENTNPEGVSHPSEAPGGSVPAVHARDQPQGQRHLLRLGWVVAQEGPLCLWISLGSGTGRRGCCAGSAKCLSLPVPHPPAPSSLPEPGSRAKSCCAHGSVWAGDLGRVSCALKSCKALGQALGSKKAASGRR